MTRILTTFCGFHGEKRLEIRCIQTIPHLSRRRLITEQPPAEAGGFVLRTESPDTRRLNDASYSPSILNSSFGRGSK